MDVKGDKGLMDDYRIVWLTVERDLNAKLHSPELLKHGTYMKHRVLSSMQRLFDYQEGMRFEREDPL